ncbi:uncharacterized protein LOC131668873 [Phymastichus coffea]|uniref:uncharacterized protein LOC131668873 n=1 Tax=Phymastichus coffea TaxID=108790 RepID=UPI00273BBCD3|nr:uncharacterized protein LOC131668873 [Phymastichus coffea]
MHVKSIILVALMVVSLALARGITSRADGDQEEAEEDNGNNNNGETIELDGESAADPVIELTSTSQQECELAANAPTDRTSANTDQANSPSGRSISDKMDGRKRINIGRHVNLDRLRNGIMRAGSQPGGNIWQIVENFDWIRPISENRERLASMIVSLIDFLIPPQMQYVDNTLRLMAIKNRMEDLLAKIFPNLHMLQHPTEQTSKYIRGVD